MKFEIQVREGIKFEFGKTRLTLIVLHGRMVLVKRLALPYGRVCGDCNCDAVWKVFEPNVPAGLNPSWYDCGQCSPGG